MPTYDYECPKCNLVFEYFQSMLDDPLEVCIHPEGCRHKRAKAKVKRLLGTGAGIIFKGSGFYETDYRSSEYQAAAKKESESTKGGGKETAGSDGKRGAKTKTDSKESGTSKTEGKT